MVNKTLTTTALKSIIQRKQSIFQRFPEYTSTKRSKIVFIQEGLTNCNGLVGLDVIITTRQRLTVSSNLSH
jgi:hypothetical protein